MSWHFFWLHKKEMNNLWFCFANWCQIGNSLYFITIFAISWEKSHYTLLGSLAYPEKIKTLTSLGEIIKTCASCWMKHNFCIMHFWIEWEIFTCINIFCWLALLLAHTSVRLNTLTRSDSHLPPWLAGSHLTDSRLVPRRLAPRDSHNSSPLNKQILMRESSDCIKFHPRQILFSFTSWITID